MSEFWEAYKRPEWQKKRLEVMKAAGFSCQECDNKEKTLNVHHKFYVKGRKPWQYDNSELQCLCETCHERFHELKQELLSLVGTGACGIDLLIGFARAAASVYPKEYMDGEPVRVDNLQQAHGSSMFFEMDPFDIDRIAKAEGGYFDWYYAEKCWLSDGDLSKGGVLPFIAEWRLVERGFTNEQMEELLTFDNLGILYSGQSVKLADGLICTLSDFQKEPVGV